MKYHTLVVGPIQTNCCIAYDEDTKEGVIIDPGDEADRILSFIRDNSLKITAILATHGHWDHVTAVPALKNELNAPFMVHEKDSYLLSGIFSSVAALMGLKAEKVAVEKYLKDGDGITFGKETLRLIHTPGHTPGSSGFYSERAKLLFSGDTLFRGDLGRTDFPGGSRELIISSVRERLFTLPGDTHVIPGHGPSTDIETEKADPYLRELTEAK